MWCGLRAMDSEGLAPSVRRTGKLSLPFRATSLILVQGPHPSGPLFPHGQLGLYLAACGCEGRYCFITRPSSEQNVVMDPKLQSLELRASQSGTGGRGLRRSLSVPQMKGQSLRRRGAFSKTHGPRTAEQGHKPGLPVAPGVA